MSTLFPAGRPGQILLDGYRWGKPVGAIGGAGGVLNGVGANTVPGVYSHGTVALMVSSFAKGLKTFKFIDRFPLS